MTDLVNMSVTEAASKGIEVLLRGAFDDYNQRAKENGYYDPNADWKRHLAEEWNEEGYDDEELEDLVVNLDNQHAWQQVKYEATGPYTYDGITAKVEAEHGGEGEGDQYWVVISVSDGNATRYFRKDGWYASYDGGYLDGNTTEVSPVERTVVFYE